MTSRGRQSVRGELVEPNRTGDEASARQALRQAQGERVGGHVTPGTLPPSPPHTPYRHPQGARFPPPRDLCKTPSPLMGEGWGEGAVSPSNVIRIDSSTESISSSTSLFQYRITLNPRELSHAILDASGVRCSWWWPPSISMTSLLSGQTKSTMYLPIGDCLLNLRPNSLRSRSLDQRSRSASVDCFLSSLALDV